MSNTIINLWASPRNISTAILYSFSQREDTIAVDEPFYAAYLNQTGIQHPGQEEILRDQSTDYNQVLESVIFSQYSKPIVFFKQMSHHLLDMDRSFILDCKNIILIRHPKEMIISFSKVIDNPKISDLGLLDSLSLCKFLESKNKKVIILNSNTLLADPKLVLEKLCAELEIPFSEKMLSWPAGAKEIDGVWAKHWYNNVHQSTNFNSKPKTNSILPEKFNQLYEECLVPFEYLQERAIRL